MKKKRCSLLLISALLSISACLPAFAEDGEIVDESKYNPKVKLSSSSTIEVGQGKTQDVVIEVKNVGTGRADNFFVQILPEPTDPFTVSIETMGGSDTLQMGASKQLKLTVSVTKGAEEKVYPVTLKYSYINAYRMTYSETDTLNIKVKNPQSAAKMRLYDFKLEPESLKAGGTGELSFTYMNIGSADENNVRFSLEGLDSAKITVPDGLSSQDFTLIRTYVEEKMSFRLKAASGLKNGSYPIKIVATAKKPEGDVVLGEYEFYISVGGSAAVGDPAFDVINKVVPSKTHDVGENFTVSFDLKNTSDAEATNVLVKANPSEENAIVPTSQSMFLTRAFGAGETKRYTFTFSATSKAKTQNYPISFDIEYDSSEELVEGGTSKIKFSQYYGVNVFNPEPEDEKDKEKEENKNIPKIIVSSYNCDPGIVPAGEEFDLYMTFMNSHAEKLVRNIKVSLTVTDKDEKEGASIFSPVNASNTLYIDQISPKQTESRSIRYYAVPDALPQNYSINVNFEYEDAEGNEIKALEIVGINVSQPPSIENTEINIPEFTEVGTPVFVNFEVYNTGKVTVNNLKVVLEGDMQADSGKTVWVGNFDSGSNEYIEASFYYLEPGQKSGKLILSYDSTTGEHFEIPTEFSVMVNEQQPMDPGMFPEDMGQPEAGGMDKKKMAMIGGGIAAVLVAGGVGFVLYKRKKKQKGDDFYE